MSLVCLILEYGAVYWDPHREGQINALDWVQKRAAKFAHHMNDSNWGTLTQCRQIARICSVFKVYTGEQTWKAMCDRLQRPYYLSRDDHDRKMRGRKQRTDIGKYSFVNTTIKLWNQLSADAVGNPSCKSSHFRVRVRKVINEVK
jgi:hypothetical protein